MHKLIFAAFMAFVFMALAGQASAGVPPGLNDTGQTQCYDASNAIADCATVAADDGDRPRQDARFGRDAEAGAGELTKTGAGAAGFDYTKICMSGEAAGTGSCPADPVAGTDPNDWACTRDNVTNLIWSIETISNTNWTNATTTHPASYDTENRCGPDAAWRAPTRRELLSIVHHGKETDPVIDEDYFPSTASGNYWSSDGYAPGPDYAWFVNFSNGYPYHIFNTNTLDVRLVHGTQLPDGSFTDNEDGTVTDTVTGLMWDKCSWGQSGDTDCATDAATTHTWAAALDVVVTANAANYKGYDDWRLPNRTELESLVDITTWGPAIDDTAFPNTPSNWYWTSTTYAPGPAAAWLVYFVSGATVADGKPGTFHVRLVRSGQSFDALATPPFSGGDGTAGDPWQIATAEELDNVRNYLGSAHADKHFVLIADINLTGFGGVEGWEPIGTNADRFTGTFDGQEHVIENLFIDRSGTDAVGLFGWFDSGGEVKNVGLENVDVTGHVAVGGLIGFCVVDGTVSNSYSTGEVSGNGGVRRRPFR